MTFDWPVPGVVHVREKTLKKGVTAETAYQLHLCGKKEEFVLQYRNFHFITLDGVKAGDARVREAVQYAEVLGQLIPGFRVNSDGVILETIGLKQMIEGMQETATLPEVRTVFQQLLNSPQALSSIESKSMDVWNAWVGVWDFYQPRGSAKQVFAIDGVEYPIERIEGSGRRVRLRLVKTEGTERLRPMMMQLLQPLLAAAETEEARAALASTEIERQVVWEVQTDPTTLRPEQASTTMTTKILIPGQDSKSQTETHDYTFDWESGIGQTPSCSIR